MKSTFKNKWFLFVLFIWAVIVAVPAFRLPLKAILQGSPWLRFSVMPTHYADSQFGSKSPELPLRVNSIKGGFDAFEWPKNFETLDKLDQLIDENPDLPWLIALRLQITTTIFQKKSYWRRIIRCFF